MGKRLGWLGALCGGFALAAACGTPSDLEVATENMYGPAAVPDIGPDATSQSRRDAVVAVEGNGVGPTCEGMLITPRLVATAAHCAGSNFANYVGVGQAWDAPSTPPPVRVLDAIIFPGALRELHITSPTRALLTQEVPASVPTTAEGFHQYFGYVNSFDWALLLLSQDHTASVRTRTYVAARSANERGSG